MGYKNEVASLNKYSELKEYCEKHVIEDLGKMYATFKSKEEETKAIKPTFAYSPEDKDNLVPVVSFDGGIATLFMGEPSETKILKVASGFPPEFEEFFKQYEDFIHVFSGALKWPEGVNKTLDEVILDSVAVMMKNDTILSALKIVELDPAEFEQAMINRFHHIKGKGAEDNVREIFELSAIILMTSRLKHNKDLQANFATHNLLVPYLLVKDGTLYPSRMTASSLFADAVAGYFNLGEAFVVGVVKNSRFVNLENSWSRLIQASAESLKSHTFFRISKKIEMSIDPRSGENDFKRFFLKAYENLYEVQIPKILSDDEVRLKAILDVIASQITLDYGGSISTNSYAHVNASLPESEVRHLSEDLREEHLVVALQELKKNKPKENKEGSNE